MEGTVEAHSPAAIGVDLPEGSEPSSLRRRWAEAALIALLALVLNLAGNGRVTLWDRDEPRYAECTREMRSSGDWIHPTFNGLPRYDKPVLIYWLMMAGTAIGGDNTFGARLVSSLAGAGTCLIVWALGRRMLGERAGRLAALILATAPIMVIESKLSTTDATLAFLLVASQALLWKLSERASRPAALGFWALMALAVLTKGPIGPALIAVSGLVSWWWGGPTACWSRLEWRRGLALFLLLAAPWFIAVGIVSHGEFYRVAMGYHVIKRVTSGIEQHGAFPGYYVVTSLLTFHPWSALLPVALVGAWARRRLDPAFGFLLGWIVGPLLLLECVRTKLVHYYLPAYPACALVIAWMLLAVTRDEVNLRRWPLGRLSLGLLAGVGIGSTACAFAGVVVGSPAIRLPCLLLAALMGAGTLVALERFHRGATQRAAGTLIAAWAAILLVAGAWLLPAAEPFRYPRIVAERLATLCKEYRGTPMLASFQEPSMVYTLGRPTPVMHGRDDLFRRLERHGTIIAALLPEEVRTLSAEPRITLEFPESIRGFNLSKGRTETLQFTLIRLRGQGGGSTAVAGAGQQPLVK